MFPCNISIARKVSDKMSRILLFDDIPEKRKEISDALVRLVDKQADVVPFDENEGPADGITYERHIERQLAANQEKHIGLVACDKDLGMYAEYPGLSANAISAVARNLGVPFCQYSRRPNYSGQEIERYKNLSRWNSEEITLTGSNAEEWAREICELWRGFEQIGEAYKQDDTNTLKPSLALATIMGRPDAATRISLYGSGDQSVMTEVFAFVESSNLDEVTHRMPRVLGTWLRLSILRFPGLLVNEIAAASYLNVSTDDFAREEVQKFFSNARYDGPFSGIETWWWRDDLESMLLESGVATGKEYLASQGQDVEPCLDCQTEETAGFYCMVTRKPVSRSNSKGNINWFPSGADLSRIRTSDFERITSLVSM